MKTVQLGSVVVTRALLTEMERQAVTPWDYLNRHRKKDWGLVCKEDAKANELALELGDRILSKYALPDGQTIYCITEADRSYTTLMFCSEY